MISSSSSCWLCIETLTSPSASIPTRTPTAAAVGSGVVLPRFGDVRLRGGDHGQAAPAQQAFEQ
jgi:hypothetical protein